MQDAKKPEKPVEAKDDLKAIIMDFDKAYRKCIRRYELARTTADQQDASNENFLEMDEWVTKQSNSKIEFECVFIDIIRSDEHGFIANFSIPRQLLSFCPPSKKPLRSRTTISLPADATLREDLIRGMKVKVKTEVFADGLREWKGTGFGAGLFHIALENDNSGTQRFSSISSPVRERVGYATTFIMKDVIITPDPDDVRKAKELVNKAK